MTHLIKLPFDNYIVPSGTWVQIGNNLSTNIQSLWDCREKYFSNK
jgi:hypothetical protein